MALTITHAKVSTAGPAADPDKVGGDDWNDDHVLIGDYLRKATVTLSSADILDLHNTPVTLVAAPGAGKSLMVHRVAEYLSYGTTTYTVASPPVVRWASEPTTLAEMVTLDSGEDALQSTVGADAYATAGNAVNKALEAYMDGAAITDGDGTLTVTVWYSIEDVPA